jgi:hypothetical protein
MEKVYNFGEERKKRTAKKRPDVLTMADVEAERERNIDKMCKKLGIDRDQAIKLASDFYRAYPMLMEYVRTPEFMANN